MESQIKLENIQIEQGWKEVLKNEFLSPYFAEIKAHYLEAKTSGAVIYPPAKLTFNAFNCTPFHQLKVVLLGQDPYHQPNQAMGLSFSVPLSIACVCHTPSALKGRILCPAESGLSSASRQRPVARASLQEKLSKNTSRPCQAR